jgi:hypothetical protein
MPADAGAFAGWNNKKPRPMMTIAPRLTHSQTKLRLGFLIPRLELDVMEECFDWRCFLDMPISWGYFSSSFGKILSKSHCFNIAWRP